MPRTRPGVNQFNIAVLTQICALLLFVQNLEPALKILPGGGVRKNAEAPIEPYSLRYSNCCRKEGIHVHSGGISTTYTRAYSLDQRRS
jgi:hypothetical protein